MYTYEHDADHVDDRFFHRAADALDLLPCRICASMAHKCLSLGGGLCYFEEGRARVIENMCHEPVIVRSLSEHNRLMKKHKVAQVGQGRGMPGVWI
jgi:hypothetical protein